MRPIRLLDVEPMISVTHPRPILKQETRELGFAVLSKRKGRENNSGEGEAGHKVAFFRLLRLTFVRDLGKETWNV